MATATVTISNVHLEGTNPTAPGSVVGSDPWNDADAGTYSENTLTAPGGPGEFEEAVADLTLPGLDVGTVATLNTITLEADLTSTNAGDTGSDHQMFVSIHDPTLGEITNFTGSVAALTGDVMETITSSTVTISDPEDLTTYLLPALDGGTIHVVRAQNSDGGIPADYTIRVHRLVLTIDYEPAGEPPPVVVTDTATRMWPRKDNLGPLASAPRHVSEWPPERLIRY